MENKTVYHFLGKEYNDIKSFAYALANNYADGINFIFEPEFLEQFTDSYLKGRLLAEQKRAYYATSAFAATIYLLDKNLGLVVNGKCLRNYHDVACALDEETIRQAVIHLFVDHTISHTLGMSDKSLPNIFEIENNINNPAIVKYFQLFYDGRYKEEDVHGYKALDYYLMQSVSDLEPFAAYQEQMHDPEFEAILCHRYGVEKVLKLYDEHDCEYVVLNSIGDDITIPLNPIADSGMHFHFFMTKKYYRNYRFKRFTRKVKRAGKKVAKHFKNSPNLELTDNQKYFDLYNFLVRAYDLGLVKAKKAEYELNLMYKMMRTNKEYMYKLVVKNPTMMPENEPLNKKELKLAKKELKKQVKSYLKNELHEYLRKME